MSRITKEGAVQLRVLSIALTATALAVIAAAAYHVPRFASCSLSTSALDTKSSTASTRQTTVTCSGLSADTSYPVTWSTSKYDDVNGITTGSTSITTGPANGNPSGGFSFVATAKQNAFTPASNDAQIDISTGLNHPIVDPTLEYLSNDKADSVDTTTGNVVVTYTYHGLNSATGSTISSTNTGNWQTQPPSTLPTVSGGTTTFTATANNMIMGTSVVSVGVKPPQDSTGFFHQ